MNWKPFHHSDWSLPVIRRRASEEWLEILDGMGALLATGGRSTLWHRTFPSSAAYRNAMSRLRKQGLLVRVDPKASLPRLVLSEAAKNRQPAYRQPRKFWNSHWNGIWYVLLFDVPEAERHYRDTLRKFLKQLRMGWLQKSVWVTPRDIRPEYADLDRSASINTVAYLMESKTVLHQDQEEIVQNAWDFQTLQKLQGRYLEVFKQNLNLISSAESEDALMDLLYQENEAYIQAMRNDPLLPKPLHPAGYLGPQVWTLHQAMLRAIRKGLRGVSSGAHDRGVR